jgi:hypothetical protein
MRCGNMRRFVGSVVLKFAAKGGCDQDEVSSRSIVGRGSESAGVKSKRGLAKVIRTARQTSAMEYKLELMQNLRRWRTAMIRIARGRQSRTTTNRTFGITRSCY